MATKKLIKTIGDVQQYLASIEHINSGGCGIAALVMYRWIKKNFKGSTVKFIMTYDDSKRLITNSQSIRNVKKKPVAPSHAGILYRFEDGTVLPIDCDGVINMLKYEYTSTFFEEELMIKAINKFFSWNWTFNRNNIKRISNKLKINLSDIIIDAPDNGRYLSS